MPEVVGLCRDPEHTPEFYMPHGGNCPVCDRPLAEYVMERKLAAANAYIRNLKRRLEEAQSDCMGCAILTAKVRRLRRLEGPGDTLQSAASRMAQYVRDRSGVVPYEVFMAALEAETAEDEWTDARATGAVPDEVFMAPDAAD